MEKPSEKEMLQIKDKIQTNGYGRMSVDDPRSLRDSPLPPSPNI